MKELLEALQNGNVNYIKQRIEEGLDPNTYLHIEVSGEENYDIPLLYAVMNSENEMVNLKELLLQKGANPNQTFIRNGRDNGWTPLFSAIENGVYKDIDLLLKYKADPNLTYIDNKGCSWHALIYLLKDFFVTTILIIDKQNPQGHIPDSQKYLLVLEALLKAKNIDFTVIDSKNMNALDYCFNVFKNLQLEVFEKVVKAGGWQLLNTTLQKGQMPIFEAIQQNDKELIKKAIAYGASLGSTNAEGETALEILKTTDIGKQALKELPEEFVVSINSMPKEKFCELLFPSLKTLLNEGGLDSDTKKDLLNIIYNAKSEAQNEPWSTYFLKHYRVCKYPFSHGDKKIENQENQIESPVLIEVLPIEVIKLIGDYIKPSEMFIPSES
ncbi:MAG: hypothetical protein K0R02_205 [Rickettsiaceae bacterium]|jgi:ankyrin repeat protein|nr:hypothetical protein [Rickettsiaceae bacterium]